MLPQELNARHVWYDKISLELSEARAQTFRELFSIFRYEPRISINSHSRQVTYQVPDQLIYSPQTRSVSSQLSGTNFK